MSTSSDPGSPPRTATTPFTTRTTPPTSHALGYQSEFKREMGPWANFALGFTYLSPVVGVYTLFATRSPQPARRCWCFLLVGWASSWWR